MIKNWDDIEKHINFSSDLIPCQKDGEDEHFKNMAAFNKFLDEKGQTSFIKYQQANLPSNNRKSEIRKDVEYEKLINRIRPAVEYYNQSRGDRMLFFRRTDEIEYDIVEEDKIRRKQAEEYELEKARRLRDAGKDGATVSEVVLTPAAVAASALESSKS